MEKEIPYEQLASPYLSQVNEFEDILVSLSNDALKNRATDLRLRVGRALQERYESLPDRDADLLLASTDLIVQFLPEAFALARETTKRLLGMRHYDKQIIAGVVLNQGNIAELKNGEGKTIVALLPAYLNALFVKAEFEIKSNNTDFRKRNIHIMTANNYLARRDYVWLKPVYEFLDVRTGYLQEIHADGSSYNMGLMERKIMYGADIVYGSSQEFIFDHLRDNLVEDIQKQVQGGHFFAIVDEADHILLDEAKTPHIINGSSPSSTLEDHELVYLVNSFVSRLYENQHLIDIAEDGSMNLSWSGKEVLRILGQSTLQPAVDSENTVKLPPEFLVGMVFQFIEIVSKQKRDIYDASVLNNIAVISQWSKSFCDFYQVAPDGGLEGLSRMGQSKLKEYMVQQLQSLPSEVPDTKAVLAWFGRMITFIRKYGPHLYNELFTTFGITPEDIRKSPYGQPGFYIQTILKLFRGEKGVFEVVANLAVTLLNDYMVDIAKVSFQEQQHIHAFLQNLNVFFSSLLYIKYRDKVPGAVYELMDSLQVQLLQSKLSNEIAYSMWAPQAFSRTIELAFLPVISNLLNPTTPTGRKDILTAFFVSGLRMLRDASQLERPKNGVEREMVQIFEELGQLVSNGVIESSPEQKTVSLTNWGQLLLEDYTEQIVKAELWSGKYPDEEHMTEKSGEVLNNEIIAQRKGELISKMRFLARRSLSAYLFNKKNNEYVIQGGEVILIDELTGRIMPGRRWNQWLHAFVEAKEGLLVERESERQATISTQSYVSLYPKRAGLTATAHVGNLASWQSWIDITRHAVTKLSSRKSAGKQDPFGPLSIDDPIETEFKDVYDMKVIRIPSQKRVRRVDLPDTVSFSLNAKLKRVVDRVLDIHETGQPVLLETVSIEQSMLVVERLKERALERNMSITPQLLNALTHEQEAEIITKAGLVGALTVSTQLAGRGTDIVVSSEALELGGLFVIGFERLDSRRWDDQVRGRAGRQGEKGYSLFYVSYSDNALRGLKEVIARQQIWLRKVGINEEAMDEMVIENNKILTDSILTYQVRLEHYASLTRAKTVFFDQVLGEYRKILGRIRRTTLMESYVCPLCRRPNMQVLIHEKAWFCSSCQKERMLAEDLRPELLESLTRWRIQFEKMVETSVDRCVRNEKLELYLLKKYTSGTVSPKRWNWDELESELSQWLKEPTSRKKLTANIDFKNNLYPETERQTLARNINAVLIESAEKSLQMKADQILEVVFKKEKNPLNWDYRILANRLREELWLTVSPAELEDHLEASESKTSRERFTIVQTVVREAIKKQVNDFDWFYSSESTSLQLFNFFEPLLPLGQDITRDEIVLGLERQNIKEVILHKLVIAYNELMREFGKEVVFGYENEVMRTEIDKQWCKLLAEVDLIIEDLSGWTTREYQLEYGVRVAQLFEQVYGDIARETVRKMLLGSAELKRRRMLESAEPEGNYRIRGDKPCSCGSGRDFAKCCGSSLYSHIRL